MGWDTYRRGRHLSIQLPTAVKNELIKIKARGGGTLTEQIVSALQAKWSGVAPAVVQPQNYFYCNRFFVTLSDPSGYPELRGGYAHPKEVQPCHSWITLRPRRS